MKHLSSKYARATFLIGATIFGLSYNSFAQSPIGVQAGMNVSSDGMTDEQGNSSSTESILGIRIGHTADFRNE